MNEKYAVTHSLGLAGCCWHRVMVKYQIKFSSHVFLEWVKLSSSVFCIFLFSRWTKTCSTMSLNLRKNYSTKFRKIYKKTLLLQFSDHFLEMISGKTLCQLQAFQTSSRTLTMSSPSPYTHANFPIFLTNIEIVSIFVSMSACDGETPSRAGL